LVPFRKKTILAVMWAVDNPAIITVASVVNVPSPVSPSFIHLKLNVLYDETLEVTDTTIT